MHLSYWREVFTSAIYLINRVLANSLDFCTPFLTLSDAIIAPNVPNSTPHVFCCVAFIHLHKHQCNKLTPRVLLYVFLGYVMLQKGYRCFHLPSCRLFITIAVKFHEDSIYFLFKLKLKEECLREILDFGLLKLSHL